MQSYYELKVITPQGNAYSAQVTHTLVPGEDGYLGVLANHAPLVTSSPGGKFEVQEKDGQKKRFKAGLGFFEVARNQATFLTRTFSAAE